MRPGISSYLLQDTTGKGCVCYPKMYERPVQRSRLVMTGKQFLSTVKYVAGTKPAFLLSEIAAYLDEPLTVGQMYTVLQPHLAVLGLE